MDHFAIIVSNLQWLYLQFNCNDVTLLQNIQAEMWRSFVTFAFTDQSFALNVLVHREAIPCYRLPKTHGVYGKP